MFGKNEIQFAHKKAEKEKQIEKVILLLSVLM